MSPLFMIETAVLVVLAISALALGGAMATKPTQRSYETLRPVTWAMVFCSLTMSGTGLANVCVMLGRVGVGPEAFRVAFSGMAELIVPVMLTFAVLTVAWGLAAIGLRRLV